MIRPRRILPAILLAATGLMLLCGNADARNPFRNSFFDVYPAAEGTQLDDLPSNAGHCGVCHFDFDGGGQRNPYGLEVEIALSSGLYASTADAISALAGNDADNDGFTNAIEITETTLFSNTPTFPGFSDGNYTSAINVTVTDLEPYLTPAGSTDTTPPTVLLAAPNGGESLPATGSFTVTWTADDDNGIDHLDLEISEDGGASWKTVAADLPDTGSLSWFVPNLPGPTLMRISAYDNAGNEAHDDSDASFTISPLAGGTVATTLRDFEMPGTQPFEGAVLEDADANCATCHGGYDSAIEPWHNWRGSMMAQSMRDPLFLATMVVAEQDAPASGDLCLRCHTPGGWQDGRSTDTSGGMLTDVDRQGVQCDFCHRMVDPHYVEGVSPAQDADLLDQLDVVPPATANGMFINDPDPYRRGPYADAPASHQFLESPFHRESDICGTCHDVSNPVFVRDGDPATYSPQELDAPHPDADLRNMFPVERTFSEWSLSTYANGGVYQPQFAGDKPDGVVSTCQDCHMRDVTGVGSNIPGSPSRTDLALHDLTGGNYFVGEILPAFWPGDVDTAQLNAAAARARALLSLAATLELTSGSQELQPTVTVRVINQTAHKLPSGYPEGRRMWLNLKAFDGGNTLVYESAAYDPATGELGHDDDARIYHIEPGISTRLAAALGDTAGPSFHFVLNDTVYLDNRIPPRGFTNAGFAEIQSPAVAHAYADSQYWDDVHYVLPASARRVEATLYYQSTSKEYIEFLRDENVTDNLGQELHDAWVAQGRAAPVVVAAGSYSLDMTGVPGDSPRLSDMLAQNAPNPFNPRTMIRYASAADGEVSLRIYDLRGRLVRNLVDSKLPAGKHQASWDGRDDGGRVLPSGVYHYVLRTLDSELKRKMVLLR